MQTPYGRDLCPPLQKIIQGFKSVTTREFFKYGYKKIWQRNYYEHVIRNEKEYYKIVEYIQNNVLKWKEDKYLKGDTNGKIL